MMQVFHSMEAAIGEFESVALTIGNFDGIHRGHLHLLEKLFEQAPSQTPKGLLTFHPHPAAVFRPEVPIHSLTPLDEKLRLLSTTGIDFTVVHPFTSTFAQVEASCFIDRFLIPMLNPQVVIVGENFTFGRHKEGTIAFLNQYSKERSFKVHVVSTITHQGSAVSSSRIRKLLLSGNVAMAKELLARPYMLRGTVVHGDGLGKTFGFPTANLQVSDFLIPADGVYTGLTLWQEKVFKTAISIGSRPTLGKSRRVIESHILDFDADLYGSELPLFFLKRLRSQETFNNKEQLIWAIRNDVERTRCEIDDDLPDPSQLMRLCNFSTSPKLVDCLD